MVSTKKALLRMGAIASVAGVVLSGLPSFASVVATKNPEGNVTVSGLTKYGSYVVEYTGVPKVRRASANACGVVSLSNSTSYPIDSSSSFTKGASSYSMSALTVGAAPKCVNGSLSDTPPASVFKDSNGVVYFTGLTAYSNHDITYNSVHSTRSAKANACGMVFLRNSSGYPLSSAAISVKVTGGSEVVNFTPSSLTAGDPPICSKGKTYFPEGWTASGGAN